MKVAPENETPIALGFQIRRMKFDKTVTNTKEALDAIIDVPGSRHRLADCTVVPSTTVSEHLNNDERKQLICLCRLARFPNVVLRNTRGYPHTGEVAIFGEDMPNTWYFAHKFCARLRRDRGDNKIVITPVTKTQLDEVVNAFGKRDIHAFLWGTTTFQDLVRRNMNTTSSLHLDKNPRITGLTDWVLWLNKHCLEPDIVRPLLRALTHPSRTIHIQNTIKNMGEKQFKRYTMLPVTQRDRLISPRQLKRFLCDRLSPEIVKIW
jgi:hypothetical protein